MGLTHVTINLTNLSKDQPPYEAEFLVDTRAIDCLEPAPLCTRRVSAMPVSGSIRYRVV